MSNDREKALEMALAQIDKQYGKGSIMRMGDKLGTLEVGKLADVLVVAGVVRTGADQAQVLQHCQM